VPLSRPRPGVAKASAPTAPEEQLELGLYLEVLAGVGRVRARRAR
jgi:hypothetical protein